MRQREKLNVFAPVWPQNIPGCQAWLEDMAERGLFLRYFHRWSAVFEKGEPAQVRYRLEAAKPGTSYADQETREDYRLLGWDYVCTANGDFHIWRCGDLGVPELYTDPQVQGEAVLRWYRKRHKLFALSVLLWFWLIFHRLISLLRSIPSITPLELWAAVTYLVTIIIIALWDISDIRIYRYGQRLKDGIPQPNRGPYRLSRVCRGISAVISGIIGVSLLLFIAASFLLRYNPTRPIEEFETPPPYVALEVLDPEAVPDRSEAGPISNPFAVSAWRTVEEQWGERLEDGGYAPDIARCETRYYRMRAGFLASAMEKLLSGGAPMEETDCPGGTRALRGTNAQGEQLLILRRGTQVMSVRYSGSGDLREHLEEAAERMENEE